MDDKSLHDLLDGALAGEPPIGPVAQNSLAAGIRLRRRRRIRTASTAAAAAAVIAVAIPVGLGTFGHAPGPAGSRRPPTLYIYSNGSPNTVTPVNTATNTFGKSIHVTGGAQGACCPPEPNASSDGFGQIAVTPDGKTAYVTTGPSVTPISTATNTPGKPIYIDSNRFHYPDFIAITPDGKTAYVARGASGMIIPISTATNRVGKPILVRTGRLVANRGAQIVITPDGKTAYVTAGRSVTPISTATNTPGKPIYVGPPAGLSSGQQIVITPDGKTAYVSTSSGTVIPINTTTNRAGKPIDIRKGFPLWIAVTPDGKTVYVTTESVIPPGGPGERGTITLTPISTATDTPGTPIKIGSGDFFVGIGQIVITPDGKTAYVTSWSGVTPISTITNKVGKPIHDGTGPIANGDGVGQIAITPDGKILYAATGSGKVIPVSTATDTPGKPIHVGGTFSPAIAITP